MILILRCNMDACKRNRVALRRRDGTRDEEFNFGRIPGRIVRMVAGFEKEIAVLVRARPMLHCGGAARSKMGRRAPAVPRPKHGAETDCP
jgi:hypothetical protein